jgi:hypothetical protein
VFDIHTRVVRPEDRDELFAHDDIAGAIEQGEQDPHRLIRDANAARSLAQLARARIYLERAETNRTCGGRGVH